MSEPFIATIVMFGGNFAPRGWAFCNGQILSIAQNTALFSLLGTTYGGNGETTFALPDLRGRVPVHVDHGFSNYVLGTSGGTESVTLAVSQMPPHTHGVTLGTLAGSVKVASTKGNSPTPVGNVPAAEATGVTATSSTAVPNATMRADSIAFTGAPATVAAGGGLPVSIVQPFLAVNYIIAIEGIFPPRD